MIIFFESLTFLLPLGRNSFRNWGPKTHWKKLSNILGANRATRPKMPAKKGKYSDSILILFEFWHFLYEAVWGQKFQMVDQA